MTYLALLVLSSAFRKLSPVDRPQMLWCTNIINNFCRFGKIYFLSCSYTGLIFTLIFDRKKIIFKDARHHPLNHSERSTEYYVFKSSGRHGLLKATREHIDIVPSIVIHHKSALSVLAQYSLLHKHSLSYWWHWLQKDLCSNDSLNELEHTLMPGHTIRQTPPPHRAHTHACTPSETDTHTPSRLPVSVCLSNSPFFSFEMSRTVFILLSHLLQLQGGISP